MSYWQIKAIVPTIASLVCRVSIILQIAVIQDLLLSFQNKGQYHATGRFLPYCSQQCSSLLLLKQQWFSHTGSLMEICLSSNTTIPGTGTLYSRPFFCIIYLVNQPLFLNNSTHFRQSSSSQVRNNRSLLPTVAVGGKETWCLGLV